MFEEFTSHRKVQGLPLFHYTAGICPETGRRTVALGIVAVGREAVGIVAIGQAAAGVVAIGQLALGLGIGLGQLATGLFVLGQVALALLVGVGQMATGVVAVGQFAIGYWVAAMGGIGVHMWGKALGAAATTVH